MLYYAGRGLESQELLDWSLWRLGLFLLTIKTLSLPISLLCRALLLQYSSSAYCYVFCFKFSCNKLEFMTTIQTHNRQNGNSYGWTDIYTYKFLEIRIVAHLLHDYLLITNALGNNYLHTLVVQRTIISTHSEIANMHKAKAIISILLVYCHRPHQILRPISKFKSCTVTIFCQYNFK